MGPTGLIQAPTKRLIGISLNRRQLSEGRVRLDPGQRPTCHRPPSEEKEVKMKNRFCIAVLVTLLMGFVPVWIAPLTEEATAAEPVTLELYNPSGAIEVTQLFSPRLADLHGKTICEVSNGSWEDYRTFPAIRELLLRQFPTAKIVPFTEFPVGSLRIDIDNIGQMAKQKGCQAVITGNAG
jgi:hypothetical protein